MKRLFPLVLLGVTAVTPAQARMVRGCVSSTDGPLTFTVDSVDCRKELTRIYGRLEGRPHTSSRIDAVTLVTDKTPLRECTDMDGVDFNRYFQWEDDGTINVELDFGPVRNGESGQLTFTTPLGKSVTDWRPAPKAVKSGKNKKRR